MNTLNMLSAFVSLRPGLQFANYGDVTVYRAYSRKVAQQLRDARQLMQFCALHDIDPSQCLRTGGGLSIENGAMTYTAGQDWSTEYRAAVCLVLAESIWHRLRDENDYKTGDDIRKAARKLLGKGIASRWFN